LNWQIDLGIEELREKRDEIRRIVELEEEEKTNIQKDLVILNKRITELDESLSRNYAYSNGYDKTIHEVEAAYSKVCFSPQFFSPFFLYYLHKLTSLLLSSCACF
jgi:predicted  nucleic acid-binding Zn-ribbon protein